MNDDIKTLKIQSQEKGKKSIESFKSSLASLRSNRANVAVLDNILVDAYGSQVKVETIASINLQERTIILTVWDKGLIIPLESSIRSSNLGINPVVDGTTIRLPFPQLTEEIRKKVVKQAEELAEKSRVVIRQIRHDHMAKLKSMEKNKEISEDELKLEMKHSEDIFKKLITEIDEILKSKSEEIMQI